MYSKRKLIKKSRNLNKLKNQLQQTQIETNQSLFQKLKSINSKSKEQVISILANLNVLIPEIKNNEFIRQLISILYQGNNSLVYETLFAMANLCQLQRNIVRLLFTNGLDQALLQLNSTDKQLLKPILIFFITIADTLPSKYHYLLHGVQNSLTIDHLKHNSQLVLQFLFRTFRIRSMAISQQIVQAIAALFVNTYNMNQKSYAIAILTKNCQSTNNCNNQIQETLINYMTQILVCVDLQKQYQINFGQNQTNQTNLTSQTKHKLQSIEQHDQEMDNEEDSKDSKGMNASQKKGQRKAEQKKRSQKLKFFMNTIQGSQILLQFILDMLQTCSQQCQSSSQQISSQQQQAQVKTSQSPPSTLPSLIFNFINQNMSIFPKFLSLCSTTVPSTENIVYLFYHLLMHVDKQISKDTKNSQEINQLVQISLGNLFRSMSNRSNHQHQQIMEEEIQQQSQLSHEKYEILVQCLQIGLKVLLKNKGQGVTLNFLVTFPQCYMLSQQIFSSLSLIQTIKPCWLIMLQLYSLKLNPQKQLTYIPLTSQTNLQIGSFLKKLLISIPYQQIQQLRCQIIDTLFDIYSNQMFDQCFVQLAFFQLLGNVLNKALLQVKKKVAKDRKRDRFLNDVLRDLKRFLQYKQQNINFNQ